MPLFSFQEQAMIKLPTVKRAEITEEFARTWRELNKRLYYRLKNEVDTAPSYAHKTVEQAKKPQMVRLYRLLTDRYVLDLEMTKLRTLEYARFDTMASRGGIEYLYCTTNPVIAQAAPSVRYDIGAYIVAVPVEDVVRGSVNRIQFFPEANPNIYNRHMHHYAPTPRYYQDISPSAAFTGDPLDVTPMTCWGNFPGIVTSCMQDGDVVELLRTLYLFVSRIDPGSPLRRANFLPHWKEFHENSPAR